MSDGASWHEVARLVYGHHSTYIAQVELESVWMFHQVKPLVNHCLRLYLIHCVVDVFRQLIRKEGDDKQ